MFRCPVCHQEIQDSQGAQGNCPRCHTLIVVEDSALDLERGGTIDLMARRGDDRQLRSQGRPGPPPPTNSPVRTLDAGAHLPPVEEQSGKSTAGNYDETIFREPDLDSFGSSSHRETRSELEPNRTEVLSPSDKVPTDVNPRESLRLGETVSQIELPIDPPPRRLSAQEDDDHAIADYMRMKYVAKGGMGQVSTTRQVSLGRTTAIKELLPQFVNNPQARARFLSEASITAELEHPNIVPVHDLGIDQSGNPFYSMKFVEGEPWDKMIKKQSRKENVETLLKVADAIAYAHSHKIIHRDIKPENVMLGAFGEVLVMDFGLAFRLQSKGQLGSGGTLMYMAPEMAIAYVAEWNLRVQTDPHKLQHYRELMASSKAKINEKSDIYLLGAILYEILFDKPPHYSLEEACQNTPEWPEPCDELTRVARRAMETDPDARHPSVLDFQQEIRTCQAHEESTILAQAAQEELKEAKQSGVFDDFAKSMAAFRESLKLWAGNTTAQQGLSDAQISCAMAAYNKGDYNLADSLAQEAFAPGHAFRQKVAKAKRAQKRKDAWLKVLRATSFLLATGATIAAIGLFRSSVTIQGQNEEITIKNREITKNITKLADQAEVLEDTNDKLTLQNKKLEESEELAKQSANLAFKHLVAATKWAGSATANAFLASKSAYEANLQRAKAEHASYVSTIALAKSLIDQNDSSRAANLLDSLKLDHRGWEWNRLKFETHPTIRQFRANGTIRLLCTASRSNRFAALVEQSGDVSAKPTICLWELSEDGLEKEIPHAQLPDGFDANGIALSDDGRWLVAVGSGKATAAVLWLYDIDGQRGHSVTVEDLVARGFVRLPSDTPIDQMKLSKPAIFVRDEQPNVIWQCFVKASFRRVYICHCAFDSALGVVDWRTSKPLLRSVNSLQWSRDGTSFLTLEMPIQRERPQLKLWDWDNVESPRWQGGFVGQRISVARFAPAANRNQIVVGLDDNRLMLCTLPANRTDGESSDSELQTAARFVELTALDQVTGIAFNGDGTSLLAHGDDRVIHTWDWQELLANSKNPLSELASVPFRGHEGEVVSLGALSDGVVISADALGFVRIGTPQQYRDHWQYRHTSARLSDGDISGDKSVVASASDDGSIRLWESTKPEQVTDELSVGHSMGPAGSPLTGIDDFIVQPVEDVSPRVVTYDANSGVLYCWDTESGLIENHLESLAGSVLAIAADGKYVVVGGESGAVQVVRLDNGKPLGWNIARDLKCMAMSRNNVLFVGMKNGTGRLIDSAGREIANGEMHGGSIAASAFSDDGRLLGTVDYKSLRLWSADGGQFQQLGADVSLASEVNRLAFVGDEGSRQILAWREENSRPAKVTVVDGQTLEVINDVPFAECMSLAVISGQRMVAALHKSESLKFYQWTGRWSPVGEPIGRRIAETRPLRVRSAGKNQLLTYRVDADGRLLVDFWRLPLGNADFVHTRLYSASPVLLARFVDGNAAQIVAASADGVVRLWNTSGPQGRRILAQAACPVRHEVRFALADPAARRLMLASDDEVFEVRVHDKQLTVEKLAWSAAADTPILGLAWSCTSSPSGEEGTLAVLTQRQVRFLTPSRGLLTEDPESLPLPFVGASLAISPDGKLLAVGGSADNQMSRVYLFSRMDGLSTGWTPWGQRLELRTRARVSALAFCSSNKRLIIGDDRGRIAIWETNSDSESQAELFALRDKGSSIVQSRMSPNEHELLSTSDGGELTVWPAWTDGDPSVANRWDPYSTARAGGVSDAPVSPRPK